MIRRSPKSFSFVLCGLVFAAAAMLGGTPGILLWKQVFTSGRAAVSAEELSQSDRIEVFEKVWKEVNDTYYDPEFHGINWKEIHDRYRPRIDDAKSDSDYYTLLSRMVAELHDSHTRFSSPQAWENRQKQQAFSIGIRLAEIDGKIVVSQVIPGSSGEAAGVQPGMILLAVDGQPIAERLALVTSRVPESSSERSTKARILAGVLGGQADADVKLAVQRADGTVLELVAKRQLISTAPVVSSRLLPSGYAYIRFDAFSAAVDPQFKEALAKVSSAPGIILDVRYNGGGNSTDLNFIIGLFFNEKVTVARGMGRKEVAVSESSGPDNARTFDQNAGRHGGQMYAGPVVVLTSASSASSTEMFAAALQDYGRAKVVGTQTCGCVIGINGHEIFKGGGVLEVSQTLWFAPKGRRLEGEGVVPDVVVVPTIADLQQNRDPALEAAEKLVRANSCSY